MLFHAPKSVPLSNSNGSLVEPTAGVAAAFIDAMSRFPKDQDGVPKGLHFVGLRLLVCLHEDGKPFLPQFINYLHEQHPEQFPVSVLESDPFSAVIDAIGTDIVRVTDKFVDTVPATQVEEMNAILRDEVWPMRSTEKN